MTSIGPIVRETSATRERSRDELAAGQAEPTGGRALVAVSPVASLTGDERKPARRSALFLAQLIANERQLPQTRERRRAEPQQALAAYGAAARLIRRR